MSDKWIFLTGIGFLLLAGYLYFGGKFIVIMDAILNIFPSRRNLTRSAKSKSEIKKEYKEVLKKHKTPTSIDRKVVAFMLTAIGVYLLTLIF